LAPFRMDFDNIIYNYNPDYRDKEIFKGVYRI
jgi:hypothetical protein